MNTSNSLEATGPAPLPPRPGEEPLTDSPTHHLLPFRKLRAVRHILVPVDFSENSQAAVRYALRVAKEFGARLTLLHIVDATPLAMDYGYYEVPAEERTRAAEKELQNLAAAVSAEAAGLSIALAIRNGIPSQEICRQVRELDADLIVASTHGYTGLREILFGGISTGLVRRAPCPVLVVRPKDNDSCGGVEQAGSPIRRFLVPVDFSPRAEAAIRAAALLAAKCHGTVSLLHVIDPSVMDEDVAMMGADFSAYSADANSRLRALAERTVPEAVRGEPLIRRGAPFAQIMAEADGGETDLLVLTTHGHTGLQHLLMGSTAKRIMKHVSTPVLIVREPGE